MTGQEAGRFFATHHAYKGIGFGAARIRALCEQFGSEVFKVLEAGDVAAIGDVVGRDCAARIVVAHGEAKAELDVVAWLARHGIDPGVALKACSLLGRESRRLIEADPYLLVTLIGWQKADDIGTKLGVAADDWRRSIGATKSIFLRGVAAGHTLFSQAQVAAEVSELMGISGPGLSAAIDKGVAVVDGENVRPAAAALMEQELSARLKTLAETRYEVSDRTVASLPATLSAEQREAVIGILSRGASILCGGAGTGKTTTLKALVEAAESEGRKCVMVAPTGKAAARMRTATQRPAKTIAALLHALEKDPLPRTVLLIIDEASMVALPEAYKLATALPEGGAMLFAGDPGQLPPVSFGVVFHILAAAKSFPRSMLTRIHRQAEGSGIPTVSQSIRNGNIPIWEGYDGSKDGVSMMASADPIASAIEVYSQLGGGQILAPTRAAVHQINAELQRRREGSIIPEFASFGLRVGDPICCTANDYALGVWNGSLGHVMGAEREEFGLGMRTMIDGEEKVLPQRYLPHVDLAYAITGHRSQGSAFGRVIVVVDRSSVIDRAWIYTCVTRAEKQVVIVGLAKDLEAAIKAGNAVSRRRVGFQF